MRLTIELENASDMTEVTWVSHCLEIDCVSQGATPQDAIVMVAEAIDMMVSDEIAALRGSGQVDDPGWERAFNNIADEVGRRSVAPEDRSSPQTLADENAKLRTLCVDQAEKIADLRAALSVSDRPRAVPPRHRWRSQPPTPDEVTEYHWWWNKPADGAPHIIQLDRDPGSGLLFDAGEAASGACPPPFDPSGWPGKWAPCMTPDDVAARVSRIAEASRRLVMSHVGKLKALRVRLEALEAAALQQTSAAVAHAPVAVAEARQSMPRRDTTVDFGAFEEMRAARDAEAATADRTARLYDAVLGWAIGVESEAACAHVSTLEYLARGSVADHALWLAVAAHRERYPASAGPAAVLEHAASAQPPSLRPWAPVGEVSLRLGGAAEVLAQLADLPDGRVGDGFLAGPVARVEALAYRDAVRVGLAALRDDGKVYRRTHEVLEDLAVARRVHDPDLGRAVDVLLDQLAHRLADGASSSMTPAQDAVLARCLRIDAGEMQRRVVRGDEDDHLAEMIDAFDVYFAVCRAKLGHDRVPVGIWETYAAIRRRGELVGSKDRP